MSIAPNRRIPTPEPESVLIPVTAMTWQGFREWITSDAAPERGRFAFLGEELYVEMSPERYGTHNAIKNELYRVLVTLTRDDNRGFFFSDGMVLSNTAAGISTEPDAMFVSHATLASSRATFTPTSDGEDVAEVVGTPDLVIEVVSPSSVGKDTRVLRNRYHAAGIPEYWLIDARGDDLVFHAFQYSLEGYTEAESRDGWFASAAFAREFRLTRQRHPSGPWQYTLHVRPPGAA